MLTLKRYQTFSREGLVWSDWFVWNGKEKEEWQMKNKQRNEYTDATEDEWKQIQEKQDKEKEKKSW